MVTRERTGKHDARVKKSSGATAAASARATTPARQLVNPPLIIVVASATPVALVYLLTNFPMPAGAAMVLIAFVATVMFSRRIREQQEQLWRTDSVPAEGNVSFTDTDAARTPIGLSTGDSTEVQAARRKERAQPELGRGRADFSTGKIALHSATGAGQDVPLLIMLISLIAAIYLLENLPFLVAAMGIIALGILNTVIFARRNRQPLDPGNVSLRKMLMLCLSRSGKRRV